MYFNAHNTVKINDKLLSSVMDIEVKNDVGQIGATCTLTVPLKSRVRNESQFLFDDVRNLFKKGDKISVVTWYDEYLESIGKITQFEGFIYDFIEGTPMKIRCLDYVYFFRIGTIKSLKYATAKFSTVLKDIIAEANKNISGDIPKIELYKPHLDFEVINLSFTNMSPGACLDWIKQQLGLVITMVGNKLYCNLSSYVLDSVNLRTDQNVIEPLHLQKPDAAFQKFKIKALYPKHDGTKAVYESGDEDGVLSEVKLFFVKKGTKENMHQKLIDNALNEKRLGHYSGKINTLLYPYCDLFWQVNFTDIRYKERSAKYIIRERTFRANDKGYHNELKIAYLGEL